MLEHSLESLNISKCSLKNISIMVPIARCINIKFLNISNNRFSAVDEDLFAEVIPSEALKEIIICECYISDSRVLTFLSSFPNLQKLNISGNTNIFISNPPKFGISKNSITNLQANRVLLKSSSFLTELTNLPNLQTLHLNGVNFEEFDKPNANIYEVWGCSKYSLKNLSMRICRLTQPESLVSITQFPRLETIDLSKNLFIKTEKDFSLGISKNTLKHIKAEHSNLQGIHYMNAFCQCSILESLDVSGNPFLEVISDFRESSKSLLSINLSGCGSNALDWIKTFKKCTRLERIYLSNNRINEQDNFSFPENLRLSVRSIIIVNCSITSIQILYEIDKFYQIETLNLSENPILFSDDYYYFENLIATLKTTILSLTRMNPNLIRRIIDRDILLSESIEMH